MMRQTLLAIGAAVLLGLVPAAAEAACSITGTLVRTRLKNDGVRGAHVLYLRDSVLDPFYYSVRTVDDEMAATASLLAAQQTRVRVRGNVRNCPATPLTAAASIGTVIDLQVAP